MFHTISADLHQSQSKNNITITSVIIFNNTMFNGF